MLSARNATVLDSNHLILMVDQSDLWRVPQENRLRWQCWDDDEFLVYNAASAQTHYLNRFAGAVLRYFESEPSTINRLIADIEMSVSMTIPSPQSLSDQIQELVKELDSLGLIVRAFK